MKIQNFCLLILVPVLTVMAISCSKEKEEPKESAQQEKKAAANVLPVETITVIQQNVPVWLEYTGKTEATQRIEVRARVSGRLDRVLFEEGEIVTKGQKLFVIEKDKYEAELELTQASLQKDKASLNLAIADVNRYKPLVAEGLAPRATLEQYQAKKGELEAIIRADQAAIREAKLNLSYTDVEAPASGRISRKLVDVGNIVGQGENTVLTTIIQDASILAYFNPTEEEFQIIRAYRDQDKMDARIRVPDNMGNLLDRPDYIGKVDFTDNRIDPLTGTISMRATINNSDHSLMEGLFIYVEIFLTQKHPFMVIPPEIVYDDQQGSYLYTLDKENKVVRTNIKRGFSTRYFLTVPEGLEEGTKVVISGLTKIRPGMPVQPTDVTATKGVLAVMKEKGLLPEDAQQ